jgi:hypothetical protein
LVFGEIAIATGAGTSVRAVQPVLPPSWSPGPSFFVGASAVFAGLLPQAAIAMAVAIAMHARHVDEWELSNVIRAFPPAGDDCAAQL